MSERHDQAYTEHLEHHFDSPAQQKEASVIGMWVFLATEIMLFGGLFVVYAVYRHLHPEVFAEVSHHMNVMLGSINTVILLTSSLTVALGVHAIAHDEPKKTVRWLSLTAFLGIVFLGIKGFEWYEEWTKNLVPLTGFNFEYAGSNPDVARIFMSLYFVMTGLHFIHLFVGVSLVSTLAYLTHRRRYSKAYHNPIETGGLYWHLVDIVWVFLYPLFYLIAP